MMRGHIILGGRVPAAGGNRVEMGMGCSSLSLLPGVCVRCVRCVCCVCYSFCVPCVLLLSEFLC